MHEGNVTVKPQAELSQGNAAVSTNGLTAERRGNERNCNTKKR